MILAAIIVSFVAVALASVVLFFLTENESRQALSDSPLAGPFAPAQSEDVPAISLYDEVVQDEPSVEPGPSVEDEPSEGVEQKDESEEESGDESGNESGDESEDDPDNETFEGVPTESAVPSMMEISDPEPEPAPAPEPEPAFRDILEGLFAEPVAPPQPKPKPAKPRRKPQPKKEPAPEPVSFPIPEPVLVPLPSEDDEPAELAIDEYIYIGADDYMPPLFEEIEALLLEHLGRVKVTFYYGVALLENAYHQEEFRALEQRHDNFTFHLVLEVPDMMALMNNVKCREGRLADVVHDDLFLARTSAGGGLFDNIGSEDMLSAHTATYVLYGPEIAMAPVRKMLLESDVPESQIIKPKIVG